jgi:NTE family protein
VLSGGGNLGATQVGMLRALVDHGIGADLVLGCSVGALNGGAYAADPTVDGVARLEQVWRGMQSHDLMPSTRIPGALQLIRKGESLYSNHGLLRTIIEFLGDRDTFEELAIPFQCVATDVDLATEQWFDSGRVVEPILASAALPAVYPMVHIGDRRYLDGGVVNNVPVARAVELGAKKIYVLHVGLHGRPHAEVRRPLDAALIAYWIARNNRFARDLAALPKSVEVIVLPPGDRPEIQYDDFDQTEDLMTKGYDRTSTYLDELRDAEANEPRLAERLRLDMFKTAEWRPSARRKAPEVEP